MTTVFIRALRRPIVCCFFLGVREMREFMVSADIKPLKPISMVTRFFGSPTFNEGYINYTKVEG